MLMAQCLILSLNGIFVFYLRSYCWPFFPYYALFRYWSTLHYSMVTVTDNEYLYSCSITVTLHNFVSIYLFCNAKPFQQEVSLCHCYISSPFFTLYNLTWFKWIKKRQLLFCNTFLKKKKRKGLWIMTVIMTVLTFKHRKLVKNSI
jgi:hypothetical protein